MKYLILDEWNQDGFIDPGHLDKESLDGRNGRIVRERKTV